MRAFVDRDTCIGCSLCEGICPKVFKMDNEGKANASEDEILETLIECAKEAKEQCPVCAISIE
jgi:ferredoxin